MRTLLLPIACLCALLSPGIALADVSPDEEVARREFVAASAAYNASRYEEALQHFAAMKQARDVPEIDYDIGRCFDRLGRWREAADAYEHFLRLRPNADNATELRARVAVLRQRGVVPPLAGGAMLAAQPAPMSLRAAPSRSRRGLRIAAGAVLAGALGHGVIGAAVYGTAYHDYAVRSDACHGQCDPATTGDLRDEKRDRTIAAGVMWGVAGVALAADIALWVLDARRASALHARFDGGAVHF